MVMGATGQDHSGQHDVTSHELPYAYARGMLQRNRPASTRSLRKLRHMDTILSTSDTERLERYSAMLLPAICHHKLSGIIGGAGEGTKQRLEAAFSSAEVQARLYWQTVPMNLPVSESGTHLAD